MHRLRRSFALFKQLPGLSAQIAPADVGRLRRCSENRCLYYRQPVSRSPVLHVNWISGIIQGQDGSDIHLRDIFRRLFGFRLLFPVSLMSEK